MLPIVNSWLSLAENKFNQDWHWDHKQLLRLFLLKSKCPETNQHGNGFRKCISPSHRLSSLPYKVLFHEADQ
jgi:hypothetical protein